MNSEIKDLIKKANRYLKSAEMLLNDGDYDSCLSRCYYAMFYVTEGLLFTKGLKASSHKGVISLFGKHFIKTGIFREELGRALRRAYDLRQKGDYATGLIVTKEEADRYLQIAKDFINEIVNYLENKGNDKNTL